MTWWIVVGVLLLGVLVALAIRRQARGTVDPTELLLDPVLVGRVRALAQQQDRVAAIALLRSETPGLGIAPAAAIVNRMMAPRTERP